MNDDLKTWMDVVDDDDEEIVEEQIEDAVEYLIERVSDFYDVVLKATNYNVPDEVEQRFKRISEDIHAISDAIS